MSNLIYTKYANERREAFRIRTSIYKDEKGKLTVEKKALSQKSRQHINRVYENYMYLTAHNSITNVCINKCEQYEDTLRFEYIDGISLTEKLNSLVYESKYVEFIEEIKKYIDVIKQLHGETKFTITDGFIKVFGKVNILDGVEAIAYPNIDLIFDNILINDKINIIDYEWIFDFAVPLKFIVFRSLNQYLSQLDYKKMQNEINIMAIFNINEEDVENFLQMERNFAKYVMTNYINNYVQKTTKLEHIIKEVQSKAITPQIFIDYGEGFSEENSYIVEPRYQSREKLSIEIKTGTDIQAIRIDPCENPCILKIINVEGIKESIVENEDYYTNGFSTENGNYVFLNSDPQIVLKGSAIDNTSNIKFVFKVSLLDNVMSEYIHETNEKIQNGNQIMVEKDSQIGKLGLKINSLNEDIRQQQSVLEHMKSYTTDKEKEITALYNTKEISERTIVQLTEELHSSKLKEEVVQAMIINKSNEVDILKNVVDENHQQQLMVQNELKKLQSEIENQNVVLEQQQFKLEQRQYELDNINRKRVLRVLRRLLKV